MNQLQAYRALYPPARMISTDFSKLEASVLAKITANPNLRQRFKDAVLTGKSSYYMSFDPAESTMPSHLFSFHPARNNQIIRTDIGNLADLQEALDNNPDFIHIGPVTRTNKWLIFRGPVKANSAVDYGRWKTISFKRLPKPLRTRLLIEPLGE